MTNANVIKIDRFRQSKQSTYMKRYRHRLDSFVRSRIPLDWASDLLRMAEEYQLKYSDRKDMVWDYVEVREHILHFVTEHVATELYAELEKQFWFDPRWITLEAVSERCLSFMILGNSAAASST